MSDSKSCAVVCCAGMLGVSVLGSTIALIAFSGIALNHESHSELMKICPDSDIWTYLIVMTIITGLGLLSIGSTTSRKTEKDESTRRDGSLTRLGVYLLCVFLSCVGFSVWGGIVLYSDCSIEYLQEKEVWYMAYVHFVIRIVLAAIVLLGGIAYPMIMCFVVKSAGSATPASSPHFRSPARSPVSV